MQYCLIENLNNDYNLPEKCIYVALTQEAVFQLDKRNVEYLTFEDFYYSGEIRGNTDKYLEEQIKWSKQFDEFIKDIYSSAKSLNLNLASIYCFNSSVSLLVRVFFICCKS